MEFNISPYYDDFNSQGGARENNYLRVLFKPGFSVQARELTQIQSILQNQIKLFGDHIFKDGSPVIGGQLSLDTNIKSIKLLSQFEGDDIVLKNFNKALITQDTGSTEIKAVVLATDDTREFKTLMIRYLTGNEFVSGQTIKVANSEINKAVLKPTDAQTVGSVISINEGIFYVDGFFVYVPEQTIILDPYSTAPTFKVGLEIEENLINSGQDTNLLDPAQASFNYQAPGADRYQFKLNLTKRALTSVDETRFFELIRVENGIITKQVQYPIYSDIEKTLARRTFDESGNYTVVPFRASAVENETNADKFNIEVDPGKAYVKGMEFETIGVTKIPTDKARTTSTNLEYDLSLQYGNYITTKNVFSGSSGAPNFTTGAKLDLHTVTSSRVNTTNALAYSATNIGDAKIRNISRVDSTKFNLFLYDVNVRGVTGNCQTGSTLANVKIPDQFSSVDDFYNGLDFSIVDGPFKGEVRKINNYVGASRFIELDRPLPGTPTTASVFSINYKVDNINSLVVKPANFVTANVYATQNVNTAVYFCADVDAASQTTGGLTYISDPKFNRLIFRLPEDHIKQSSINNADFYYKKFIPNVSFTGSPVETDIALISNDRFYYGADDTDLASFSVNQNILVFVKDKLSSNAANGAIAPITAKRINQTSMKIYSSYNGPFLADVLINVKAENSEGSNRKVKTFRGLQSVDSFPNYNSTTASNVDGADFTKIDAANGVVWFSNNSVVVKTPGVKQSLYIPDVIKILKIYDSGNNAQEPSATNAIDVTNRYLFDTGQTDNYYDHASIILKGGQQPPTGQTAVFLQYFEHTTSSIGYFNADSYSSGIYNSGDITVYNSSLVPSVSLRDVIDFRPTRTIGTSANVQSFNISGALTPLPDLPMELNYSYYIPRVDYLIATPEKEFKVISGQPSRYPQEPSIDVNYGMLLYKIFIPAFTAKVSDIRFEFIENRRYTMRDIGVLEKRITDVEEFSKLTALEVDTLKRKILYADGTTEKEKYGVVVDSFNGFDVADTENPDLLCNISNNELKPYKILTDFKPVLFSKTGPGFWVEYPTTPFTPAGGKGKTYSLVWVERPAIEQPTATRSVQIQPYLFGTFKGNLFISPSIDTWISTALTPNVNAGTIAINRPPTENKSTPVAGGISQGVLDNSIVYRNNIVVLDSYGFEFDIFSFNYFTLGNLYRTI